MGVVHLTLKARLMLFGLLLAVLPLSINLSIVLYQNAKMTATAGRESQSLAYEQIDQTLNAVRAMCATQRELVQRMVNGSLNIACALLEQAGPVTLADNETVSWKAAPSGGAAAVQDLPRMFFGDPTLAQAPSPGAPLPLVEKAAEMTGMVCGLFQLMQEQGDMLLTALGGAAGLGVEGGFVLAGRTADGTRHPVIAAVGSGRRYTGTVFIAGAWYEAAFAPVYDAGRRVVGMLCCGMRFDHLEQLRREIMAIRLGQTGYVFVLDSRGTYILSKDGKRDGENMWDTVDMEGKYPVREIVGKALALQEGSIATHRFLWKNPGEAGARMRFAKIVYFRPWDWVICAGSYEDEFQQASRHIQALGVQSSTIQSLVGVLTLLCAVLIWYRIARGLSRTIGSAVDTLRSTSAHLPLVSDQVASASRHMATSTNEQAAGIEETSSSLEEMAAMTSRTAENAIVSKKLSAEAAESLHKGMETMQKMSAAIGRIEASSERTAKIIKTIDEIAFQTNLLALNAAVEAARAGEAGRGFAVVAEEVRALAQRSAVAARDTAQLIDEARHNAGDGVAIVRDMEALLKEIGTLIERLQTLVAEVSASSLEQSRGIQQINSAVVTIDKSAQSHAATAEEVASAAQELVASARQLDQVVGTLVRIAGISRNDMLERPAIGTDTGHGASDRKKLLSGRSGHQDDAHRRAAVRRTPQDIIPFDEDIHPDDPVSTA